MAKKKAAPKKKTDSPAPRVQTKKKATKTAVAAAPAASSSLAQPRSPQIHVYRHEIPENPTHASLVVDIPIAAGRGDAPPVPSYVGFTAEMSEEYWQDQFAFRVVSLSGGSVRVMISRIDKSSSDLSWGVKLVVHVLVVDGE
jgi:hypothetical protein